MKAKYPNPRPARTFEIMCTPLGKSIEQDLDIPPRPQRKPVESESYKNGRDGGGHG
jgi:hypothetical protein